jgi:hypothetical protein
VEGEVRRNPNYWSKRIVFISPSRVQSHRMGVRAVSSAKLVNKTKDYERTGGRGRAGAEACCFVTDELQSLLATDEIGCFSDHQITLDIESVP